MKKSRTVTYQADVSITGSKGHLVRTLLTAPALLISGKKCILNTSVIRSVGV